MTPGGIGVTVDVAIFALVERTLRVVLVERANPPFLGRAALPGGFVEVDESLEDAAARELHEETGVDAPALRLIGVYGDPGRDPRGRVVSVAYWGGVAEPGDLRGGDDAARAFLAPVHDMLADPEALAFDHGRILADGVDRVRRAIAETDAALSFLPERFALADLRLVYETVWGVALDPDEIESELVTRAVVAGPDEDGLYRAGSTGVINPPLRGNSAEQLTG